jgi:proteasome lid subunit RPN8/RPN11
MLVVSMLILDAKVLTDIRAHCEEVYPRRACGLLVGRGGMGKRLAFRSHRIRDRLEDSKGDRFELHPLEYKAVDEAARGAGEDVVGVYHSHPDASADASPLDAETAWEGYSWLVIAIGDGKSGELRSFEREDVLFEEESIEIRGEDGA